MRIFNEIEQGSPEWLQLRIGKVTGTRVKDAIKADNLKLVDKIISELVTEEVEETYCSADMQRGKDMEPLARQEYESYTGYKVDQIGFALHDNYNWLGLSPDGLIEVAGKYQIGVEIKCPKTDTHVRYIRENRLPVEYKEQVYNYFIVNPDLKAVDFVSYDNRFLIKPLHIVTVARESIQAELEETEKALVKFWDKVQKYYNQIIF